MRLTILRSCSLTGLKITTLTPVCLMKRWRPWRTWEPAYRENNNRSRVRAWRGLSWCCCVSCQSPVNGHGLSFSPAAGGVVCPDCQGRSRDSKPLASQTWEALRALKESGEAWQQAWSPAARKGVRQLLDHYVTYLLGRRPRLLPYLGS